MTNDTKTALILEGGGCKGAFEAGVIKFIDENKIDVEVVIGTSVGGLNAACFAFDKVKELLDLWSNIEDSQVYKATKIIDIIEAIEKSGTGIIGGFKKAAALASHSITVVEVIKNFFCKKALLDNSPLEQTLTGIFQNKMIRDASKTLCLTAFELESGQVKYFDKKTHADTSVVDALMATSAIQAAFPPRIIGGKHYVDGGNGANLAITQAIQYGCRRLIAVRANAAEKEQSKPFDTCYSIATRALLASFGNVTNQDIIKAKDDEFRIEKALEKDAKIHDIVEETVSDPTLRFSLLDKISKVPAVFSEQEPLDIKEIVPDHTPDNILEFSSAASCQMIDEGFQKAKEKL